MLQRFCDAQAKVFSTAFAEIKSGQKRTHWMWYIFPQLRGLGHSETAIFYGIKDLSEAKAFLADEILGKNLSEISQVLLDLKETDASKIFGYPDDLKLRSSMTLFAEAAGGDSVFRKVLDKFFEGNADEKTLDLLRG